MKFERIDTRKKFKEQLLGPKRFKEIIVPGDGTSGWAEGAYTLAFVYSNTGNFLIKGYLREVKTYIKKNFDKYFVNYSLWYDGRNRNIWDFWKKDIGIFEPSHSKLLKTRKWEFRYYYGKGNDAVLFKRLPKCWVKELEIF